MPITQVGTATTAGSSGAGNTSLVVNKPTGIASGDFMLAILSTNSDRSLSISGWTLVSTEISANFSNTLWYKVAGGSEPSSYTVNASGGTLAAMGAAIIGFTGVNVSNPINVHQATATTTKAEPATGPSATLTGTTRKRVFYLRSARAGTGTVFTYSTAAGGVAELVDNGGFAGTGYSHALYWQTSDVTTSGSTSGIAITCSGTETDNVERTFALNAADPFDTDTGTGSESAESVDSTGTDSDSGVGTESEFIGVPITDSDSGAGSEAEDLEIRTHHIQSDNFNRSDETLLSVSSSGAVWTNI
jgi:hypothetical protein